MAIENSVFYYFGSTFVGNINIFDCHQSSVIRDGQCKGVVMMKFPYTFLTFCMLGNFAWVSLFIINIFTKFFQEFNESGK